MTKVPNGQGVIILIDDEDWGLVSERTWHASWIKDRYYVQSTGVGYLHRFLMEAPQNIEIDHRDGNGLNNQRANLRLATHAENMRNQKIPSNNTSGVKGVTLHRKTGKWRARITRDGKSISLGLFTNKDDAATAVAVGLRHSHGEFANLG